MLFWVGGWKWSRGCLIVPSSMKSPRPHLIYCSLWTSSRNLENISVRKHETRRTKTKRRTRGELKRDMLQMSLKRNCFTSGIITVWCTLPWLLEKLFLKHYLPIRVRQFDRQSQVEHRCMGCWVDVFGRSASVNSNCALPPAPPPPHLGNCDVHENKAQSPWKNIEGRPICSLYRKSRDLVPAKRN